MIIQPPPLDTARAYHSHGWMPLSVPYMGKNPGFTGWQRFNIAAEDLHKHFKRFTLPTICKTTVKSYWQKNFMTVRASRQRSFFQTAKESPRR